MRRFVIATMVLAQWLGPGTTLAADEASPASGAFSPAGALTEPRMGHSATLLPDGRVLVIAGDDPTDSAPPTSAELWDPETATFSLVGSVAEERSGHTATLLPDGRVLVIGGTCCRRNATVTEIWDRATQTFREAAPLVKGRIQGGHTATLLPDGRVLVIGGIDHRSRRLKLAEVWDPETESFTEAGQMEKVRVGHTATLLPDGRVLVIGGSPRNDNSSLASAETWDPETASFKPAGSLSEARTAHTATLLPDGRVLVIGGGDPGNVVLAGTELWDPVSESFSAAGDLAIARLGHTATPLAEGRVFVVGGNSGKPGRSALASSEVWDPFTGPVGLVGSLEAGRWDHTATLLPDGRVLVIGGNVDGIALASAEAWDPTGIAPRPWPSTTLEGAQAITTGHDRFVVVGEGGMRKPFAKAWISSDGQTWTRAPDSPAMDGAGMHAVISSDDGFVALGTDARQRVAAWHSPDGLIWERGTVKRPGKKGLEARVRDIVDGPTGLMAFGVFTGQDYGGHRFWHSKDGQTWRPIPGPDVEDAIFESLVAVPDGYLLISPYAWNGEPSQWRSTDGRTWTAIAGAPWMKDAAAADDGTVVGLGLADIWTTRDLAAWGLTWESPNPDSGADEEEMLWLTWDGSQFAAHAVLYRECDNERGKCQVQPLLLSSDGYAWVETDGPDGVPGDDGAWMFDIASLGETTVVLGGTAEATVAWRMEGAAAP